MMETSYSILIQVNPDQSYDTQRNQIEHLLNKIETQIIEKGLKLFVDFYDEKITTHISALTNLDYLD